jgi:gamma-glutamylcyclotransferase (GGCT)/AIG2-like uncharacterized protein YtfP
MSHNLFVYGTLRPGNTETMYIPGRLYDLGWFPGLILDTPNPGLVAVELTSVPSLAPFDLYEGYSPQNPESSLYIRQEVTILGITGWIYVYNNKYDINKLIPCGDWLKHRGEVRGKNCHMIDRIKQVANRDDKRERSAA